MSKLLNVARQVHKTMCSVKSMDRLAMCAELIEATDTGSCKFQWKVTEEQVNGFGTLHGGYTAFMVDYTTSAALEIMGADGKNAATVDMSISYMNAAKIGETVTMETEYNKCGSKLAFMEARLLNKDGKLLATGKHTMFVGETKTS